MQLLILGLTLYAIGILASIFDERSKKIIFYASLSIFCVILAFNEGGGWDYSQYEYMVYNAAVDLEDERISFLYRLLLDIAQSFKSFRLLLLLSALLTSVALLFAFKSIDPSVSLYSTLFFLLAPSGVLHQISELRQAGAVCFFAAAICNIYKKNYFSFIIFMTISLGFHISSLLALVLLVVFYILYKRKIIIFIILPFLLYFSSIFENIIFNAFPIYSSQITNYLSNANDYGKYYFISIAVYLMIINIVYLKKINNINKYLLSSICLSALLGFVTYDLGRLTYYFIGPIFFIFLSELNDRKKIKDRISIISTTFATSIFLTVLIRADMSDNQSFNSYNICFLFGSCL
jgi:hypothetical protein